MKNLASGAKVLLYILSALCGGFLVQLVVVEPCGELCGELLGLLESEPSTESDDVAGLLELLVVGAEADGFAEGEGLEGVVYAFAKAAPDVGHMGIAIEGGEHADVVDNEDGIWLPELRDVLLDLRIAEASVGTKV